MIDLRPWQLVVLVTVFVSGCDRESETSEHATADRVFTNGVVYTVDAERSYAEAVAIRDGLITFVGKSRYMPR